MRQLWQQVSKLSSRGLVSHLSLADGSSRKFLHSPGVLYSRQIFFSSVLLLLSNLSGHRSVRRWRPCRNDVYLQSILKKIPLYPWRFRLSDACDLFKTKIWLMRYVCIIDTRICWYLSLILMACLAEQHPSSLNGILRRPLHRGGCAIMGLREFSQAQDALVIMSDLRSPL